MKFTTLNKTKARNAAKAIRHGLTLARPGAGSELLRHWPLLGIKSGTIAGYIPIHTEIDVWPLMGALVEAGHTLALPRIRRPGHPLTFHTFNVGDKLVRGPFGTKEPVRSAPVISPDVILLPLLAYARDGSRLGYGGGYYDRTLNALRSHAKIFACGVAFSGQEVPTLPTDGHDQRLDGVLTETGLRLFS
ncbi:MAG: 5-formyltetrahydrofolate cyclo-ligase [Robiginitomaculum sp.]|nr:5-formyltetrahydrofolate cyclo-ligase [Robiginitomaculum sp.]